MLLERASLLDALHDRLADARQGSGSVAFVGGEAGAGKTALVSAFLDRLDDATLVLEGACDPLLTPRPLSPLRDVAAHRSSGLGDVDFERTESSTIFRLLLDRLTDTDGPVVLVIEDLHWADQGTLDLLRFLGRRVGSTATVLIGTFRDDELGLAHPLRHVLGQLATLETSHRFSVPPLSGEAVANLAEASGFDAATLHELTGGNAFFVSEALAGGEILPPTVQDAVLARVAQLSDSAREVVRAVSIAPRFLELARAATLLGDQLAAVDEAVDAGAIVAGERTLRFRHELARSAVEQTIPPGARHALHRRMVELLLDEQPLDHARLAHHAIKADSPALIVEYAPKAADEAARRGALREAAAFLRATLEHRTYLEPPLAGELLLQLASHLIATDDSEAALAVADEATQIFRTVGSREREAAAIRQTSRALGRVGRADEALAGALDTVAMLEPLGETEALANALAGLASEYMLGRRVADAVPHARRALEISERLDLSACRQASEHVLACLELIGGDADRGIEMIEASVADVGNTIEPFSIALGNLGSGAGEVRRYDVALDALRRAEAHCVEHDLDSTADYVRAWSARIAFEQGEWSEAVAAAELIDRTAMNRSGYALVTAEGALGRVRVRRGDPGGGALLVERLEQASGHNLQYTWPLAAGVAEHHWLRGETDHMSEQLEPVYRAALQTDSVWARGELGFWMWKAGLIDTAPDRSAQPFALQIDGRWRGAAEAWAELGCPYEQALALADGDNDARLAALAILDGLGAGPLADRVRADLRSTGAEHIPRGPSAATQSNPWQLTPRQVEVLRLIGDGLANGEIAARLFVSKKTVEHHVSAIYLKLGVDTREKAMLAARDLPHT